MDVTAGPAPAVAATVPAVTAAAPAVSTGGAAVAKLGGGGAAGDGQRSAAVVGRLTSEHGAGWGLSGAGTEAGTGPW